MRHRPAFAATCAVNAVSYRTPKNSTMLDGMSAVAIVVSACTCAQRLDRLARFEHVPRRARVHADDDDLPRRLTGGGEASLVRVDDVAVRRQRNHVAEADRADVDVRRVRDAVHRRPGSGRRCRPVPRTAAPAPRPTAPGRSCRGRSRRLRPPGTAPCRRRSPSCRRPRPRRRRPSRASSPVRLLRPCVRLGRAPRLRRRAGRRPQRLRRVSPSSSSSSSPPHAANAATAIPQPRSTATSRPLLRIASNIDVFLLLAACRRTRSWPGSRACPEMIRGADAADADHDRRSIRGSNTENSDHGCVNN